MNSLQSCRVQRMCVCPVGVSVWPLCLHLFWVGVVVALALPGPGAGARARGGWQQWWAVRTTRGRLAHREQRRGGDLARAVAAGPNRTVTNRWKSPIQERNTMHLRTLSEEKHTHRCTRQNSSIINTQAHAVEMHPAQKHKCKSAQPKMCNAFFFKSDKSFQS